MGKGALCIKMLQLLNTGRLYSVSELAGELEITPRSVIEYKKEIDLLEAYSSGFTIDTVPGRYGGYRINGNATIPALKLTPEEAQTLVKSYNYLYTSKEFTDKKALANTYAKIMSNLDIESKDLDLISVSKTNVYKKNEQIKKWFKIIEKAIKDKTPILMKYEFLKEPTHVTKVHPYKLFIYDGEWRFFAWSCEVNDIFYYKLSRIEDIQVTDEKPFKVYKYFKIENYLKDGVFTQNGEMFKLTLIASGVRAKLFQEKDFGKNQVCEELPDGRTKVTLEMQKNHSTYNFILGCGDLVEVVEPEWLREKVRDLAKEILKKYE